MIDHLLEDTDVFLEIDTFWAYAAGEDPLAVIAALGAVIELNTEHYKGDFKYDVERFKEATKHLDGDNNRLLRMSCHSGTWCIKERGAYIKGAETHGLWNGYATLLGSPDFCQMVVITDRILAYAVRLKGLKTGA